jgi:hypothetical protein
VPESVPGPSASGSVVLELGPGIGALVLHAPPKLDGRELDICAREMPTLAITHSRVRCRRTARGMQHAAVYPDLRAGDYLIRLGDGDIQLPVTIVEERATIAYWPNS